MQTTPKANNILGHFFALFGAVAMLAIATWVSASSSEQVKPLDNLAVPRTGHTATALSDGKILITGGRDADGNLVAASEIFDPETQTSSASAALQTARVDHSATVLADGRVLVAGGTGASGALSSAEMFDPAHPENGFQAVGSSLSTARTRHTATLLNDGHVLIAGGDAQGTAELFDPATGTFMPTIWPLTVARSGHTATLFTDDSVLLAGGNTATIETYTAGQGFTLDAAMMSVVRTGHWAFELSDTRLLLFQGDTGNSIDEFNPSTGTIAPKGSLDFHASSSTLLANGKVLVLGTDVSGLYNPDAVPPAPDFTAFDETSVPNSGVLPRSGQAAVELPGDKKILITGGVDGNNQLLGQALFNPAKIWTDKDDYQPDEPVILSASGWKAAESIYLFAVDNETEQWTYEMTVPADANGEFVLSPYFIVELRHLGVQFHVTALGAQSTMQSDVYFTDSNPNVVTLIGAQTPNPVTPGNTASYGTTATNSVSITFNGNNNACTVNLSASGLPAGATANFNPASVTSTNNATQFSLLTISTTAAVPAGTYTFTIAAQPQAGCQNTGNTPTTTGTLVVSGAAATTTAVTSSSNPSTYGDSVTFTATVTRTSGSGTPTGSVNFDIAGIGTGLAGTPGATTANTATWTYTTSALTAGNHSVSANYVHTGAFQDSSGSLSGGQVVNKANATVVVTPYSVTYDGSPHTATVTSITGVNGETGATVGTVTLNTTHTNAGTYSSDTWAFTGTTNYNNIAATTITDTIGKANATVTVTPYNVTYDGASHTATVASIVGLNGETGATVGTVGLTGTTHALAGTYTDTWTFVGTANYNNTSGQVTDVINGKHITGTFTAGNKVYDGNNSATVLTRGLSGVVSPDVVILTGGTATFSDKNVGNGKTVTLTGATLSGADAPNYVLDSVATTTANITAKNLTINGAGAQNKQYDGNTTATVDFTGASLVGVVVPDVVTINNTGYTANFADKNVGNGKAVTATGVTLSGTDADNYTVSQPSGLTANITAKNLTINSAAASNKQYDGNDTATVDFTSASLAGVIAPDVVTINSSGYTALFNNKNVGNGKPVTVSGVTLSGGDAGNYTVSQPSGLTANITAKNLTISGAVADNKQYDGNDTATVDFTSASLAGVIAPDVVTINNSGYSANFNNKNVGNAKPVTVSGVTLSGGDAGNYTVSQPGGLTANITAKNLTINSAAADNKQYDGNDTATVGFTGASLAGVIAPDVVSIDSSSYAANFNNRFVGNGKPVTVSGVILSGPGAGNYTVSQPSGLTANITPKNLTINGAAANNKQYDGNDTATVDFTGASLAGVIAPDVVTINSSGYSALFNTKTVGNGKPVTVSGVTLSGGDAGNYTVSQPSGLSADITAKNLTINGAVANNKQYNGNATATVDFTLATLAVVESGDSVSINSSSYSASFATKTVGTGKPVTVIGVALSGADAGNYTVSQPSGLTADITAKNLTISGAVVNNKQYDSNTTATVDFTSATLAVVESGDMVNINSSGYSASFATKTVGTGKPVTVIGVTLSGADAGNYTVSQPSGLTADITAKNLTINGAVANNKQYDSNTAATADFTLATLAVVESGDSVSINSSSYSASFATKTVGNGKPVTVSGVTLSGLDAGNYTVSQPSGLTADITAKNLTISGAVANNKQYDSNTIATVDFTLATLAVVESGDSVSINSSSYTADFDSKNIGNGKPVTVSGVTLSGADAGNYTVSQPSGLTADITVLHITGSFTAANKVYDGNNSATVSTRSLVGAVSGDAVSLTGDTATFSDKTVGNGKTVTLAGASLSGGDAGNYVLDSVATTTANITILYITGTFTTANKVYDGNNSAMVLTRSLVGAISGDVVSLTGGTASFADKNVGMSKTVTLAGGSLSGMDADNYVLDSVATTTANITALHITGSFTADHKVYDGNTSATVLTRSLSGTIVGDIVSLTGGTASFADKNVGMGKTVTLASGSLSGMDAGNYVLDSVATTTANITVFHITGTFTAANKVYNGNTSATVLTRSLVGAISGDAVSLTGGTATFADKNVGMGKTVTLTGATLSGGDTGNYVLDSVATATANITPASLTITAISVTKTFGGTYTPDTTPPSVDFTITGTIYTGDSVTSITLTCAGYPASALPGSPYTITPSYAVGTGLGNYNIGYVTGQLTIGYGICTGGTPGHVILPPINPDGSSVWKVGSTVPVKFTVCDANGNPISDPTAVFATGYGGIALINTVRGTVNNVNETTYTDIPDSAFRWSGGQWIFNMATSNLQKNQTYTFRINLKDGSYIEFTAGTK